MNILILIPHRHNLRYAVFDRPAGLPTLRGALPMRHVEGREAGCTIASLWTRLESAGVDVDFDVIGVRVAYGGEVFAQPVFVDDTVLTDLARLADAAPLDLPRTLSLLRMLRSEFASAPVLLAFETSFFTRLPDRECRYALPASAAVWATLRRRGHHGIYHEAACSQAATAFPCRASRPRHLLSLCLEPCPELAAVRGMRPLVVTRGATPLEGLPGQTTCGEMDPGVVLELARGSRLGPEEIDSILTRQSGLYGLTGTSLTLHDIFAGADASCQLGREVILHRLLLAVGAGIAALGSVDAFVFSGRFAPLGERLGAGLIERLPFLTREGASPQVLVCPESLEQCMAALVGRLAHRAGLARAHRDEPHDPVPWAQATTP